MKLDKHGRAAHPAKFSPQILEIIESLLPEDSYVLDPMAGAGLIHSIPGINSVGIEIEQEWVDLHPRTFLGDATKLVFRNGEFPYVVTSPVYGNRMSDHHNAKDDSVRHTYKHYLGRDLHPNNSGQLHWSKGKRGDAYRKFHRQAWREVHRVLRPTTVNGIGGLFILNVSNFYKGSELQKPAFWHKNFLTKKLGFVLIDRYEIETKRMKHGENRDLRDACEYIFVFQKPQ